MRVAAFTGGKNVSSARFRVRQWIPRLREYGIEVDEFVARFGSWPPESKFVRPLWLPATLLQRVPAVMQSHRYDLTFLQREMVSTLATLERFSKAPRVLDLDDAVWLNGRGTHVGRLAEICAGVICGNRYIAAYMQRTNKNICVIPTAVDTVRFRPRPGPFRKVIGWSGLPVGLKWVDEIGNAIGVVLERHPKAVLRIVCSKPPRLSSLPPSRVEFIPWSPQVEVSAIQEMTVGLMPLEDSAFTQGKCSYKMLLYMACGVPAVVAPIGMNAEVLAMGPVGFGARSLDDWVEQIDWLLKNEAVAASMGQEGRRVVERHFSMDVLLPRLAGFLHRVTGGRPISTQSTPAPI